jgi:hypothetical protein
MNNTADPDLIKITEVFLVPSSFLVAAIGTADTNPHRAAVSVIGFVISVLWWICSREALAERRPPNTNAEAAAHSRRVRIMSWLPMLFIVGWAASVVEHILIWNRPLGH